MIEWLNISNTLLAVYIYFLRPRQRVSECERVSIIFANPSFRVEAAQRGFSLMVQAERMFLRFYKVLPHRHGFHF